MWDPAPFQFHLLFFSLFKGQTDTSRRERKKEGKKERKRVLLYGIPTRLEVKSVLDRASLTVVEALKSEGRRRRKKGDPFEWALIQGLVALLDYHHSTPL
jgi:hypothetical protein